MIYFAYASNLDPAQWGERCPASPLMGVASLRDHRLHFPRHSPIRNCAVASLEHAPGEVVWGALYRMDAADVAWLDNREGYYPQPDSEENRYDRLPVSVDTTEGYRVGAQAYIARHSEEPGLPSAEYLAHIIAGAEHHKFPDTYIAALRQFPTLEKA